MAVTFQVLDGWFDNRYCPIVGLYLESGQQSRARIDTGCNTTLLFTSEHAEELGIGLPSEYNIRVNFAGEARGMTGERTITLRWFDGPQPVEILVLEPPRPGSLVEERLEKNHLALLGIRLLFGCEFLMQPNENYQESLVRITKKR